MKSQGPSSLDRSCRPRRYTGCAAAAAGFAGLKTARARSLVGLAGPTLCVFREAHYTGRCLCEGPPPGPSFVERLPLRREANATAYGPC